ncbi:hypothetical protein IPF86_03520 [Candidatus Nomurabacteria bacterium]|jgi:UDP-N-acetylmuramate: L-alanyl-gamma-D-glutamyl-meso-diaminopimelate ligase|nr:MAG: hypothetical protein IPF86_03520 [Candidatus Nomurabacteria bacterium]
MKAHFIGICGKGMSGVASMLKQRGWEITGSDSGTYEPVFSYLVNQHISFSPHYAKENIPRDVDVIIIGKHAELVPEKNEEVKAAFDSGIRIASFPEIIRELAKDKETIVVAGSYGKSTCTALLAWCLKENGKDPSYFIGAVPLGFEETAHLGDGELFIIEGDEYPSANWDLTSKFLYYTPSTLLLTSGEHDHLNIFPTEESYLKPYKKLLQNLPSDGLIVAAIEHPNIPQLLRETKSNKSTYSLANQNGWYAKNLIFDHITSFDLYHDEEKIISLETKLLGKHNIENCIGVSAVLLEKNLLTPNEIKFALASFEGLEGRINLKSQKTTVHIYDGFGSSYAKARSVFDALKLHFPNKKIITVFEPHTFSWRNKAALPWYDDLFRDSDNVVIFEPPTHGKASHEQSSFEEILDRVHIHTPQAIGVRTNTEATQFLNEKVGADDIVVLMSSGGLDNLPQTLPIFFEKKFPKM